MEKLIDYIVRLFTTTGPWLSKKWLYVLPLIGFLTALLLIVLNLIPSVPDQPGKVVLQTWRWVTLLGLPVLLDLLWIISTQFYLRTGSGVKIGVVYEGYKVDLADWKQTKAMLKDLFQDEKIKKKVSLRFVPLRVVQADKIGQRFAKRYSFTILLTLEESKTNNDKTPVKLGLSINTKQGALPFMKTTIPHCLAILAARPNTKEQTALDILRNKALNLHDLLLFFVATHNFVMENYEDASAILRHIDQELDKARLEPMRPPRFQIREFFVRSCISKLNFSLSQVPSPDELEQRIQFAENAMPLFNDFAGVYTSISRAKFLIGDVDSAIQLTTCFQARIEELQKTGHTINADVMFTLHLNAGFLAFIQRHWEDAYNWYDQMIKLNGYKQDWSALVEFIDYVDSLEQYEGICYLKMLYRKLAGQAIGSSISQIAMKWLHAEDSHLILRPLLSTTSPVSKNTSDQTHKSKKKQKIHSQRR